jgi:hypothetical protein
MLKEIAETIILGVGLAASWFYLRSILTGDLSGRSLYRWAVIMIPLGVSIIWGLKVLGVI